MRSVGDRVAEVDRVPDGERLDGAALHVASHFGRQTETGDVHLANQVRVLHGLGGSRDTDSGRGNDRLQVRVALEQALRFTIALVGLVVAVGHGHQLQILVFRLGQDLLHFLDPGVLVGGLRGGGENGDFAAVADGVNGHLDELFADQRVGRREQVEQAAILGDARVKRQHLDAAAHGLLGRRYERVRVIGRNDDGVDLLRDERVDQLDLTFRSGLRRAGEDDLDVAEFLGGFVSALVSGVEEAVTQRLDDHGDLHLVGGLRVEGETCGDDGGGGKCLGEFHENLLELSEYCYLTTELLKLPNFHYMNSHW